MDNDLRHIYYCGQYRKQRRFIFSLYIYQLLIFIAILPVVHRANAAVPVPMNIQVEYYSGAYCNTHSHCCTEHPQYPGDVVAGGMYTNAEQACSALMEEKNKYFQCRWSAQGYSGTSPSLYDDIQVSSSLSCFLLKDGGAASTHRNLTMLCPDGYAGSSSPCLLTGTNPGKNNNICPKNGSNPIHTALGYKLQTETDYTGANSNAMLFKRYYGSGDHWEQSGLGDNWRHTYARSIRLNATETISTATVYRPNGGFFYFTVQQDGTWLGDLDVTARLTRLFDTGGEPLGWEYIDNNNNTERYDAAGKLSSIINLAGLTLSFGYDSSDRLISISDSHGRSMSFAYDEAGRINQMTDPSDGVHQYSYSAENKLVQVTRPNQTTRQYHYNEQQYTNGTNLPNALTGITDENGVRYAIYQYDTSGRAISSEHAGNVNRHSFSFNTDGTTTITNSLGKETTYHFVTIEGVKKVTQVEGHSAANCEGANKNYTYNSSGFITSKTDWNGNTTTYTHDARGLELSRTEAAGTPEERTITTEWHPQFRLPTKITEPNRITEYTYDTQGHQLSRSVSSVQ